MIRFTAAALAAGSLLAFAQAQETPDITTLSSGEYVMDKTHGYVTFSYSHLGFSNPILRFDDVDAMVTLDAKKPTASTLSVEIDPASINTGIEKFDTHLQGGDFFDVENHPGISFTSTAIDLEAGTLTGDLTIKGITKPVTLDVMLNGAGKHPFSGKETFGITAIGTVDRTEWGLSYAAPAVSADVDLLIEAEFQKAE